MSNQSNRLGAGVLAAAIACTFATPALAAPAGDHAPTNRFIVKFKSGTSEQKSVAARKRLIDAAGVGQGLHLGQTRRLAVGADLVITDRKLDARAQQAFMRKLRNDPRVEYVVVDRRMHPMLSPNDTRYLEQWDLRDLTVGIKVPSAWDISTGTGVVVAVIDTGITDHPDLSANILPGYDFIGADGDGGFFTANDGDGRDSDAHDPGDWVAAGDCGANSTKQDSSFHGTHVSGTVAALTNNALGVAGIAFNAKVQPLRALGRCGGYTSDIADAIVWAAGGTVEGVPANPTPAEVINMSLGGGGACDTPTQLAIDYAVAHGTTVVVAAGNDKKDASAFSPASCDNVVTVAATDNTGARANYSNFGDVVDLAAPGGEGDVRILSTMNPGATSPTAPVDYYVGYNGTSMASPHVAGVAALMQSHAVNSPEVVEAILKGTARAFPGSCVGCGTGLLTATTALSFTTKAFLYVSDVQPLVEGDSGTQTASFKVRLSKPLATAVTFDIATADATAAAGSDYVAKSATGVTIPAGQTETSFDVVVNGDTAIEGDERFNVNVTNVVGVQALGTTAHTSILNDDADAIPLQNGVALTGLDAIQGTKTLYRIDVPANASNLTFSTTDNLAGEDIDIFARFQLPASTSAYDDLSAGPSANEQIVFAHPQAGRYYLLVDAFTTYNDMTLVASYDGGTPPPALSIGDATISEGNSGTKLLTFTASLSAAAGTQVTFNAATANGTATAGSDYVALNATGLTIPAGQLSKTFTVTVNGDTTIEENEQFFVNLSGATGATIADGQGIGTITNDDTPLPSLSINNASVTEGNSGTKLLTFTASLSQAASSIVTFNANTQSVTAAAGVDFVSFGGPQPFSIPAGQLSTVVNVTINGDTTIESNETFNVNLSSVVGATLLDGQGVGTITNDDSTVPGLRINDVGIAEGDSGTKVLTFTASLTAAAANTVTFNAATQSGTAAVGSDFVGFPATGFNIPAGQLTTPVSVTINGDTTIEGNETFNVNLSSVSGATLLDGQGVGTITNDDTTTPTLRINDVAIAEGNSGTKLLTFTATLSAASASTVTFNANTQSVTAAAGSDFVSFGGPQPFSIPAGQLSRTVSVTINGDTAIENNETFNVNLSSVVGATLLDGQGVGTINNDDVPGLRINDVSISEGNTGTKVLTFTASLTQALGNNVTFNAATQSGTAAVGSDFVGFPATGFNIPAGQTTATINVTINGDTTAEANETFNVNLSSVSGTTLLDGQGIGTITNDD